MKISKTISWVMGHALSEPYPQDGPCAHLHGHNYKAEIRVAGAIGDDGMVFDAADFNALKDWVNVYLDHRMMLRDNHPLVQALDRQEQSDQIKYVLNDILKVMNWGIVSVPFNPTAENLAILLATRTATTMGLSGQIAHIGVTVWETDTVSAIYEVANSAMGYPAFKDYSPMTLWQPAKGSTA
ncbi:MAG: 6-carboxytetrahydropterin synthase [Gammaproteobacteria bacterium]|nr:6-carboxytetrahydropterin synthase [Gammaproteobacteria bacterium]